jgi:EmrB/QacA subfamily drug resistance transporter
VARDRRLVALAALCGVLFLTFLDNTIVGVALADLQTPLDVGVSGLQWVVDGYMLAFAALMLAGGTLGDLLGRKRVMLFGLAVLIAGSVVSAVAPTTTVLIVGRVVMGVGAAASEPGTLSLIRQLYPEPGPRARAVGVWTAVSGVALSLGPIIGGILVGAFGWRGIFWFNVAAGAVALFAASVTVPESRDPQGRLDVPGLALIVVATTAATFAIIEGQKPGYTTWWVVLLLVVAVAAAVAFVAVERRVRDPLLPLGFFRNPAYAMANIVAFATNFALYAVFVFTALYLRLVAGFSTWRIAVLFIPLAAALAVASVLFGHPTAHVRRWPMVAGCVVAGGGMLLVDHLLTPDVSLGPLAGALLVVGVGFGAVLVTVTASALALVPAARSGMAASTVNASRELGGVMGVAILGAAISGHLTSSLDRRLSSLGVPSGFHGAIVSAVTHGQAPTGSSSAALGGPGLARQLADAARSGYGDGMHTCMAIAAAVLLIAGLAAAVPRGGRRKAPNAV